MLPEQAVGMPVAVAELVGVAVARVAASWAESEPGLAVPVAARLGAQELAQQVQAVASLAEQQELARRVQREQQELPELARLVPVAEQGKQAEQQEQQTQERAQLAPPSGSRSGAHPTSQNR